MICVILCTTTAVNNHCNKTALYFQQQRECLQRLKSECVFVAVCVRVCVCVPNGIRNINKMKTTAN